MKRRSAGVVWVVAGLALLVSSEAAAQGRKGRDPTTWAVLINGGANKASNFLSHYEHMQEMHAALEARGLRADDITLFNADGAQDEPDMATREAAELPASFWLIEGSAAARHLKPPTTWVNTTWEGAQLHPARYAALRGWFQQQRKRFRAGDTLVIYVTDHGQRGVDSLDNGTINLWGEQMSVLELRALLGYVPAQVRVVLLMSQCFSGSFAMAMYGAEEAWPSGQVCGYFSTTAARQAYGCYPEGRAQQRLGHAFTLIDALRQNASLADAHDQVSTYDSSPDVPLRTRDVFLERLLRQQAEAQHITLNALVDRLLHAAWDDATRWRGELATLDRIAAHYGLPSPRSLETLERTSQGLQAARDALDAQHRRWDSALDGLRAQLWEDFLQSPDADADQLAERLNPARLQRANEAQRQTTLEDAAPAVERFARRGAARFARLQTFHGNASDAASARYRMDIRLAVNLRLRTRLMSVAGAVLLEQPGGAPHLDLPRAREALAALQRCEDAPLGAPEHLHPPGAPPAPLTPLHVELARLEQLRPTLLGVRYGAAPDAGTGDLPAGAALLRSVDPGSPAAAAGLTPDDVVLSVANVRLEWPDALRDVVMTSPAGKPLEVEVLRAGKRRRLHLTLTRQEAPALHIPLPVPPGADAPPLQADASHVEGKAHVRLFVSRTCGDACVPAAQALHAWSRRSGVPWTLLTDADRPDQLPAALRDAAAAVVLDPTRARFDAHGIHGDPTFIAVDRAGVVRFRQVGFRLSETLTFEAWRPGSR